jgi:uncharacterized protein (TIGR02646 family)
MLDLNKAEPEFFTEFKRQNSPRRYHEDCNDFDVRNKLREFLLSEQKSQCFYCEKKIGNSDNIHIDHIKQRTHYNNLECDYNNIVVSCNGNGESHCGKYKDKHGKWDDSIHLNLEYDKPSQYFKYVSNGKVIANKSLDTAQQLKAETTITYINLNHNDLIGARKNIFLALQTYEEQGFVKEVIFGFFNEFESLFNLNKGATA